MSGLDNNLLTFTGAFDKQPLLFQNLARSVKKEMKLVQKFIHVSFSQNIPQNILTRVESKFT